MRGAVPSAEPGRGTHWVPGDWAGGEGSGALDAVRDTPNA